MEKHPAAGSADGPVAAPASHTARRHCENRPSAHQMRIDLPSRSGVRQLVGRRPSTALWGRSVIHLAAGTPRIVVTPRALRTEILRRAPGQQMHHRLAREQSTVDRWRPTRPEQPRGGAPVALSAWRHHLCVLLRELTLVSVARPPGGPQDELLHHWFRGAKKRSRQILARRKCRRTATQAENDNNPQNSLWAVVLDKSRRRPTLPRGLPLSTIGAGGLNCRVRKGNGCVPTAMATGNLLSRGSTHYGRP